VEKYGLGSLSRAKEVKKINPHGVLAVKIRWDRVRYRVLGFVEEMCFWTLLIFKQKSKKIPQKHLKTAMWRKRQIKNLYKSGQKIFSIKSK
jgi:phage-related protein